MKKAKVGILDFVAEQIKELRTNYNNGEGISQEALAKQIGVAPNTISRWETAIYKPGWEDVEKLARFFGIPMTRFIPPDKDANSANEDKIMVLLRAARELHPADLEELMKYAEFRKARRLYEGKKRPKAGRKGGTRK
jgi:transcriptional regulator with XRE-family HTH domain